MTPRLIILSLLLLAGTTNAQKNRDRGDTLLSEIKSQPLAKTWKDAKLIHIRLVEQKPDLAEPTGLRPAWFANIKRPNDAEKSLSYLMWESQGDGALIEFALDGA